MTKLKIFLPVFFLILITISLIIYVIFVKQPESNINVNGKMDSVTHSYYYGILSDSLIVENDYVRNNETLGSIFAKHGISNLILNLVVSLSDSIFDYKKIREGEPYSFLFKKDSLKTLSYFIYEINPFEYILYSFDTLPGVKVIKRKLETKIDTTSGIITSSLWKTMTDKNMDINLIIQMSDVYAWVIDFYDVKVGDKFKIIYEKKYADDKYVSIGKIKGAWFFHNGNSYTAVLFKSDSNENYYNEKGENLKHAFLKAPLDFTRISSRFSPSRMHPILKIRRPHFGVDYSAPIGTPVKAIGNGTIVSMGFNGGAGRMIKVRYNSVYSSVYMHLSGFAKGLKSGSAVSQGQVIGYVGSSGLSTGPHLDFRVYKNNQPVDPLKIDSPPDKPVKQDKMKEFDILKDKILLFLNKIKV